MVLSNEHRLESQTDPISKRISKRELHQNNLRGWKGKGSFKGKKSYTRPMEVVKMWSCLGEPPGCLRARYSNRLMDISAASCWGASQVALVVKNLPTSAGDIDLGLIPGSGRSPGGGNGNLLQYSCLENSMDRGAGSLQSMGVQRVWYNTHCWIQILALPSWLSGWATAPALKLICLFTCHEEDEPCPLGLWRMGDDEQRNSQCSYFWPLTGLLCRQLLCIESQAPLISQCTIISYGSLGWEDPLE